MQKGPTELRLDQIWGQVKELEALGQGTTAGMYAEWEGPGKDRSLCGGHLRMSSWLRVGLHTQRMTLSKSATEIPQVQQTLLEESGLPVKADIQVIQHKSCDHVS